MNIQKRSNGKWRARYRDDAGKEHARHFVRKVEAQRWLDEVTTSRVTGQYVDPGAGRITFADFYGQWKARQVWTESTTTTADRAADHVPFADMPIGKIRTSHVQEWVREMLDRPLAASTVVARFNYVHMVFRGAVADRRITEAPSASVRLPKVNTSVMTLPTVEQVAQALSVETWFRGFIAACAFAGLRQGEAAGLQVGDIDWLGRTIRVRRQVVSNAGYVNVRDPKYGQRRNIPAPSDLMDLLAGHVETYGAHGVEQWLFWSSGRIVTRSAAGNQWRRLRTRFPGMEDITLHDLRHFYASGLIADGCDVVTVQKALGHSKPSITLDVYSHLWPRAEDRTRGAADRLMGSVADSLRTTSALGASD